jgi:hypothetical protein
MQRSFFNIQVYEGVGRYMGVGDDTSEGTLGVTGVYFGMARLRIFHPWL